MDILDEAVTHIANDDYNHVPEDVLRQRLAAIRMTRLETELEEEADVLIASVRDALYEPGDPEYGPGDETATPWPGQCKHRDADGTACPNDATSALENGYCSVHEAEGVDSPVA